MLGMAVLRGFLLLFVSFILFFYHPEGGEGWGLEERREAG